MKLSTQQTTLISGLLLALLLSSCSFFNESETNNAVTITGQALHETTGDAVVDAIVRISQPQAFQETTVSDSNGRFTFRDIRIEMDVQFTIEISKDNFHTTIRQVTASPGREATVDNVLMRFLTEDPPEDPDENGNGAANNSGGAASLILTEISRQSINIQETGGIVNSEISFVVQDSSGRSLSPGKAETVYFEIVAGPGGSEAVTPESAQTDDQGAVSLSLISGYTAGVVKIEARIEREDIGLTIRSKPITVAIHGGYPDQDRFSISVETFNFEGLNINGIRNPVSVIVGDKFSNPVKPDTPVYFSTTHGIIQGSGTTDEDGQITVDLISGNPRPGDGYATITAVTYNEYDDEISVEIPVLFSGSPTSDNITITPETFNVPAGGGQTYALTVTDENGNPLPAGTTITVELENERLTLSGDTQIKVPNAQYAGQGVTEFTFSVRDHDEVNNSAQQYDISVAVETPNGFTARRTFSD